MLCGWVIGYPRWVIGKLALTECSHRAYLISHFVGILLGSLSSPAFLFVLNSVPVMPLLLDLPEEILVKIICMLDDKTLVINEQVSFSSLAVGYRDSSHNIVLRTLRYVKHSKISPSTTLLCHIESSVLQVELRTTTQTISGLLQNDCKCFGDISMLGKHYTFAAAVLLIYLQVHSFAPQSI
jgi:hypothetical protein